ncbi:MAG: DNA-directed RNA polymerase subunit A' [Candidatus Aenigmatarchaeota archaeon]|nr:MAG: DNA-directed RNA polymerase subunit A' [Candidatus Aenigmarchaeota archaeon]
MPAKIDAIEFRVLSPEQIKKMAVVEITKPELYDRDGYPIEGGVMDPHLGVIDPGMRCRTCGGTVGTCQGHFGYMELARPVIHVRYVKVIYKLLRATCQECGKALGSEEELKRKDEPLYDLYIAKRKKCPHCGATQQKIMLEKPHNFLIDGRPLTPLEIRMWLEKIPDETLKKLDIKGGRPEHLILTLIPIPPVTMRPSITLESGERSEDDLTHKIVDMVRINQRLRDNIDIGAPDFIIEDLWELLQYHVSTYFDNSLSGVPQARHRSGRALRTLTQRLKGKQGRFRGNLSGKRVNFSSRTVISPDPYLGINEVGVPIEVAKELTVPVRVNERNLTYLKSVVKKGSDVLGGANYIIRPDGRKKKITEENKDEIAEEIGPGYIVERHLQDGDIVLFNRQPSLHRMSIMAHRVRVMPYRTFRLNLSVCKPYNADFDGDEMNLHVPQTEEAQTEAEMLMLVQNHIRSPRFGGPIIGCIQDHISGLYLLTKGERIIPKEKAIQLLGSIGIDVDLDGDITGKELFSMLLPKDLNLKFKPSSYRKEEDMVVIKKGKLISGVIDEKAIGGESGLLIEAIEKDYGSDEARVFLERVAMLGIKFLTMYGFTIGLDDEDISKEARRRIDKIIEKAEKRCFELIEEYENGEMEQLPGQTLSETLETHIQMVLQQALNEAAKIVEEDLPENCAVVMAKSGARGSMINLTQLGGVIGQQTLQGKRIHRGYTGRTLSHFKKGELSPKAHGFVSSSFKGGMTPYEFFFNAMNGREGLMDKSLRTRYSGYMERRLVNALQDLKIEYDGTVRDNRKVIIQFTPGEDQVDPAKSNWGKINVKRIVESVIGG